jgi:hypothetical protein
MVVRVSGDEKDDGKERRFALRIIDTANCNFFTVYIIKSV